MSLVNSKEIAKVIKLDKLGWAGTFFGWLLLKTLRISKLNRIYERHKHKEDMAFLDGILGDFKIDFEIPEDDLVRIPKEGAFITVSNHPLGGIDGILLLKLLVEKRPDYKIIANFLLHRIVPLQKYVMPVNPFEDHKDAKSSITGIKNALLHLSQGYPLGIFPAGEVSTFKDGKLVVDKPWEEGAIKIIKKANVPVIPIYFHAKNSTLFYFLSRLNPTLRTAKLPSELLTQKNRVIKVRIGKPISVKEQDAFTSLENFHQYLRKKTYMLANPFEKNNSYDNARSFKFSKSVKKIIEPVSPELMKEELKVLDKNDSLIFTSKSYRIYLADSKFIPNTLREIGRLREVTFREVGEGTNKSLDLDKFDNFYKHLFLWDDIENQLVGAYRMGFGKDIFSKYGIEGFYVNELFKIEPELFDMMENTFEMGRAFIVKSYQKKPMPLFLLWKGIVHVTLRYPNYKYLMGGVSISNQFSNFSKSLMIEFMKSHYYDPFVAQYVSPKKEYKVRLKDADKDFVFDKTKSDLKKFDKVIDEIEPGNLRLPVLLKKYIKQNAHLVGFNVDPKFNNAVDGLLYIRIADLPESTVKPVMEEFQAELERKLHQEKNGS
jgi:putative hemolysin